MSCTVVLGKVHSRILLATAITDGVSNQPMGYSSTY